MSLTPGARLDVYEILGTLGSGGMGEVYRARDSVLKREVAIKVLPPFVSQDPDRLRRFRQEAEAAAALNHPNILAVHQLGTFEGSPYLVSELLEGDNLRQVMQRGPLPVRKAIDYGVQIAHGLAAAHEKGIVHRDLKPENLFVTKDGRVKILDFGLAKLIQRQVESRAPEGPPDSGDSGPTLTHQGTEPGLVLGTVGYMAPEQVRGKPTDHRADIFAFGAILYEMLAGKRAFEKPTSADTMSAILNEDPPAISQIAGSTPPGLQRVVQRCLEKNPEQRFQSASDLAFALEALSDSGSSSAVVADKGLGSGRKRMAVSAGVAVALFVGWWFISPPRPSVESVTQLTDDAETKQGNLDTDGSRIYFNEGSRGALKIAQVSVTGGPTALVETKLASPTIVGLAHDGSALLAMAGENNDPASQSHLWTIPLPVGEPHRLGSFEVQNADFFPDGRIVYGKGKDLFAADRDGSNPHKLISLPGEINGVVVSPDGERILSGENLREVNWVLEMASDGTGVRPILKVSPGECCLTYSADAKYLLYISQLGSRGDIWALPVQSGLLHRSKAPIQLTNGPTSYTGVVPSRDGTQIFALGTGTKPRGELVRYESKSQQFLPLLSGISATDPTFSKDGKWVTYVSYPDHTLWRSRTDGTERLQLTYPPMDVLAPYISPDGKRIAFSSNYQIYLIGIDGGLPERIVDSGVVALWSPDGNLLVFSTDEGLKILDTRTRKTSAVPGAQHMVGAWWVNMDMLVAATRDQKKFLTFDLKTQKWTDLLSGDFVNWTVSQDGMYLYFVTGGVEPKAQRIRLADHRVETITTLKDFHRIVNNGGTDMKVAPDGSLVFTRDIGSQEVYALSVRWP